MTTPKELDRVFYQAMKMQARRFLLTDETLDVAVEGRQSSSSMQHPFEDALRKQVLMRGW